MSNDIRSMFSNVDSTTGQESASDIDRQSWLPKVRALLTQADNAGTPEEADAFRATAEALMLRWKISQHELAPEEQPQIDAHDVDIAWYWNQNNEETRTALWSMFSVYETIKVVGLKADVDYFDLLYTSMAMELGQGMEPKPKMNESMIHYLVRAKESGMTWERMAKIMLDHGIADFDEYKRNVGVRFTKLYTDYCTQHDRPRLRVQPSVYQRSFRIGFSGRMSERLQELRRDARAQMDNAASSGLDMVLADIWTRVQHKAEELFPKPNMNAISTDRRRGRAVRMPDRKIDMDAVRDGRKAADSVDLSAGKSVSGGRGQLPR
jgi:hypothetical protein